MTHSTMMECVLLDGGINSSPHITPLLTQEVSLLTQEFRSNEIALLCNIIRENCSSEHKAMFRVRVRGDITVFQFNNAGGWRMWDLILRTGILRNILRGL
jgi:hypothetical protein